MVATYGFHFEQPWWLLTALAAVPLVYLAVRSLRALGGVRRVLAIALRCAVVGVLAVALARPAVTKTHDQLTALVVLDRSLSVPADLQGASLAYLAKAIAHKPPGDQLAVIDVAEAASIARLPSTAVDVPKRNLALTGRESRLAAGIQMAMAIAPPNTAVRIILVSDGNETAGDLKEAARIAAANGIRLDVLPLRYHYGREVVFRRLVAPGRARIGQPIGLRFVLTGTREAKGRLMLTLNGRQVDLDPTSADVAVPVTLKAGTNVHSVSLTAGPEGVHEFEARFLPDDANQDTLSENNRASGVTFVAGAGHVLLVAADPREAAPLADALAKAKIEARAMSAGQFPTSLTSLLDADAVVLVNTPSHLFTLAQQEMLCRYVTDLGGGLVTVGGPESYGAGGWIGSPVATVLPVDMDPPQKKQMPKGALVLIMHACEMPQGNFWGKQVAIAAVNTLSQHDLVGVLDFGWNRGASNWVYPLSPVGNRRPAVAAIQQMQMGDMPDFGPPVQAANAALSAARAGQKHIIIISDGDPQMPSKALLDQLRAARVTCTGVAVFPHQQSDVTSLSNIARYTGGRFYNVQNANSLPQIFVKEAQVVRRSLILEDPFVPRVTDSLHEILRGLPALPQLDGRVLTGPKGGLNQMLLACEKDEPLLAAAQAGLGRTVSLTSSADRRWASRWVDSPTFGQFWKQAMQWVSKSPQATDCEVFTDVQGRSATVTVEAVDPERQFVQFADLTGQVIFPDMTAEPLELRQIGPGQYRANFQARAGGSYLVNLRYRKAGEAEGPSARHAMVQSVVNVPFAPEFEDLTDNAALLAAVAATTGGRILSTDPAQAELFSRAGLTVPKASLPITKWLLLAWVGLFLLDVGVRRVALDVRAMARRLAALLPRRRAAQVSETLAALKKRRKTVQQRLAREGGDAAASRRYQAGQAPAADLPQADLGKTPDKPRPEPPAEEKPQPDQPAETHVGRLLKAKRRVTDRRDETRDQDK